MPNIPELKIGDTIYDLHDKRVDDLKIALRQNYYYGIKSLKWFQGTINGVGALVSATNRIRTGMLFIPADHTIILTGDETNQISVTFYDANDTFSSQTGWIGSRYMYHTDADCYIAIVQSRYNSADITPSDGAIKLTVYGLSSQHDSIRWANLGYESATIVRAHSARVSMIDPLFLKAGDLLKINVGSNMYALYYQFDTNGVLITSSSWTGNDIELSIDKNCIVFITTKKRDESAFAPDQRNVSFSVCTEDVSRNLIKENSKVYTDFVQGGLSNDGTYVSEHDLDIRLRLANEIKVKDNDHIHIKANLQGVYWYFFDASKKIIEMSSGWSYEDQDLIAKGEMYFTCTIAKQDRMQLITPEEAAVVIMIEDNNAYMASKIARAGQYLYSGERILVGNYSFDCEEYLKLSQQPSHANGCAIWDGKLFVFNNVTAYVYSVADGTYIGTFTLPADQTCHSNTVTIAPDLHSGNTQYPYFYISEFYGSGKIYVFNIVENEGAFTATLVQTIVTSELTKCGLGYADFAIDFDTNRFLLIRYAIAGSYNDDPGNNIIVSEFALPQIGNSVVTLTDNDIVKVHTIYHPIYARQQCLYRNNRLFILAGTGLKSHLYVSDLDQIITDVPIGYAIKYLEPEGMAFFDDGILVVPAPSDTVFKMTFA